MLIWFVVLAPVAVALVFNSPMLDYRLVSLGAVLPLIDIVFGGPRLLHTLFFSVAVMAGVMATTMKRRLLRRRLLGLPIGLMFHQLLDGSWTNKELFWWPAFGTQFGSEGLPEWSRSIEFGVLLELVAVGVGVWAYGRFELNKQINRDLLLNQGHLARSVLQ